MNQSNESNQNSAPAHQPASSGSREAVFIDPVSRLMSAVGIGLVVAFFFPSLVSSYRTVKLFFLNIEGLMNAGTPGIIKFQLLYPLLAGILVLILARRLRTAGRAFAVFAAGLFPFLVLLANEDVQRGFRKIARQIPGTMNLGAVLVLSIIAVVAIMAGALASRTKPRNTIAAYIAAGGAGLYVLLLLIPVKGEFQFITPFKMLFARDYTGTGLGVLTGLVGVSVLLLMIIICVKCFQLPGKESYEKSKTGASIIKLWFVQFAVYGFYVLFLWLTSVGGDGSAMGMVFIALILGLIKYFLWIMGLFFLIPLGVAEIILLGPESDAAPVQEMTPDSGERKSTPSSVEQRLEELLSLKSKGLITDEEYEQRKKEILKEI